jgi:hypothetical protein
VLHTVIVAGVHLEDRGTGLTGKVANVGQQVLQSHEEAPREKTYNGARL